MFHNPHGNYPRPNTPNQQPMQPMHPQQMMQQLMQQGYQAQQIMQMMMQQGYNQQQIVQLMQQMMPQQGYPQQQMMPGYNQQWQFANTQTMPQQGYPQQMQPGYNPQMMPQQVIQQGFSQNQPQQNFQRPQQGFGAPELSNPSRFGNKQSPEQSPQPQQQVQQMQTSTPTPAQTPNVSQQLTKLSKVKMVSTSFVVGTRTAPYTPDDIVFSDDTIAVVDCVEEAIEQIAELFNCDTTDKVVKNDYVIINKVFGLQSNLFETNLTTKPKELSKMLKDFHGAVSTKSMLVYSLSLNEFFTDFINSLLAVNTNNEVNIDSFMDDYIDLCDTLTGSNQHVGKEINDKLELYLTDIKTAFSSFHVKQSMEEEGECPCNYTPLLDKVSLFYVDVLNLELNLNLLSTGVITEVINTSNSKFSTNSLYTLIDSIYSTPLHLTSSRNFIVTYDKSMYELFTSSTGKYYIKAW